MAQLGGRVPPACRGPSETSCEHNYNLMLCTVMQVATLLEEYFSSGDLGEAAAELADMGEPELQHFFVKRAVTAALDKHNREREMTSILLSSLYSEVRPHQDVQMNGSRYSSTRKTGKAPDVLVEMTGA